MHRTEKDFRLKIKSGFKSTAGHNGACRAIAMQQSYKGNHQIQPIQL